MRSVTLKSSLIIHTVMLSNVKSRLEWFLAEDIGSGDITSSLLVRKKIRARIISREQAVVAGARFAKKIFELNGCKARILQKDGTVINPNRAIITMTGDAGTILACERTALNILARMSGIATQTRHMKDKMSGSTKLYATRKTAPGLRYFDKVAVEIGGGHRHRMRLDEMIMIKDNHIAAEGSLESLIKKAKKRHRRFEVEVENTEDAVLAASNGAAIIMLDNFTPIQIKNTIRALKKQKLRDKVTIEASGRINATNVSEYARTGVDIISAGSITNSVRGIDMSLEVTHEA